MVGANAGYAWDAQGLHKYVHDNGGFGGGQFGYNWQGVFSPNLVFGLETDIQGAGISNSGSAPAAGTTTREILLISAQFAAASAIPPVRHCSISQAALLMVRRTTGLPRIATGDVYKDDAVHTGFTFGGGIEYKITPVWFSRRNTSISNLPRRRQRARPHSNCCHTLDCSSLRPNGERAGYVAIMFMDDSGKEVRRERVWFRPSVRSLGNLVTNADGQFRVQIPPRVAEAGAEIRAYFPGSASLRSQTASISQ